MKSKIFMLLLFVTLFSTVSYAQKIIVAPCGFHPMIDCSGLIGTTDVSKQGHGTPKDVLVSEDIDLNDKLFSPNANAKPYKRFEVATTDLSTTSWSEAVKACDNFSQQGTRDWRLPTHREMLLILVLYHELDVFGAAHSGISWESILRGTKGYWTATESDSFDSNVFAVGVSSIGTTAKVRKVESGVTTPNYIRCIREVTDAEWNNRTNK